MLLIVAVAGGFSSRSVEAAGMEPAGLKDCPGSPNCVSSEATEPEHRVYPFRLKGDRAKTWPAVLRIVAAMHRTVIIIHTDHYIQAESKSRLFGFVDDLELLLKPETGIVSVRSASRSGYYDFGVNRKRIESLRQALRTADLIEPWGVTMSTSTGPRAEP
ncbi:MAG: DUF1499 domain-containing protein [Desulfobacterales bacterium]|nr:DUF1499 domain-containing protein [Desulfobacterales bacterium]